MGRYSRYHAGAAAEMTASRKQAKYAALSGSYVFQAPADCFGNFGPNQQIGCAILKRSGQQNHF